MKTDFCIKIVQKKEASDILLKYHYLKDHSRGFKSGYNYGLFKKNEDQCLGVCIFTIIPVPEIVKGAFGLERNEQEGLFELSRLCLKPEIQKEEYNITSWFVAQSIRQFKKDNKGVRAILSYADSDFHSGTIYKALNFKYYGLTDAKKDFWIEQPDGSYIKHSRGKTKGVKGEWRDRSRKHRFLMVFDKKLKVLWQEKCYI